MSRAATTKVIEGAPEFAASGQEEQVEIRHRKPTDDELGEDLIRRWRGRYKFIYGTWHKYENGLWKPDQRAGMEFWNILIMNKRNGIKPNAGKAASVERYCQLKELVDDEQINAGWNYINLRNGVYNLQTDEMEPHRPDLYMTWQLPFSYDPENDHYAPTWYKFLDSVIGHDHEMLQLLQQAMYYSLTADTSHRVSFWLVGASGTGKSTLLNVLIQLAGDSHVAIDLDTIKDNQYQLADIAGKRVVTFTEPDSRAMLADGWYKKLVSKDTISARHPYGKPFNFIPICKVWGAMNDTPRVADRSDAIFGRVIIIPMNRVIPPKERDVNLDEKLRAELPSIFSWVLAGKHNLISHGGFVRARVSEEAREEYRRENDPEALYVEERCVRESSAKITARELYADYKAWCIENGYQPRNEINAGKQWRRLGFRQYRTNQIRGWEGVRLITEKINFSVL